MSTRRQVVGGLAAVPVLAVLPSFIATARAADVLDGDKIPTSGGDAVIHPVHHASLVLGFNGAVIYVDPVDASLFSGLPAPTVILVTHAHGDHFDVPTLTAIGAGVPLIAPQVVLDGLPDEMKQNAQLMANGDKGEVAGIPLAAVPAYNTTADRLKYHPKGVGNGYLLTFGDKVVYVAGDTEDIPEMRALTGIEVAFLPMNLPYTMTEEQAADAVKAFKPKIVYPYHYQGSDPKKFADLVGGAAEVRLVDWYASK
jgi:L-ascorbate metabolism protein UlaG (beta-lactamase superfamily)